MPESRQATSTRRWRPVQCHCGEDDERTCRSSGTSTEEVADGRLELFVAADGLRHAWQAAWSSNGWSGWVSHGPPPPTIPGAGFAGPGVAAHSDGRLALFVANGQLWRLEQTAPSNGWTGWLPHGAPAGDRPGGAIRSPDGRIEVFVVDTGGSMWNLRQTSAGGPWSGWNAFGSAGGGLDGCPALAVNSEGRLELFVRGKDGVMWRRSQVGGAWWSDWVPKGSSLPGISVELLDHPAVAVHPDGRLDVFMTGGAHPHPAADRAMWQALQREVGDDLGGFADVEQHRPAPSSLDTIHFGGAAPAVGGNGDGRVELFAVGADGDCGIPPLKASGTPGCSSQGGSRTDTPPDQTSSPPSPTFASYAPPPPPRPSERPT